MKLLAFTCILASLAQFVFAQTCQDLITSVSVNVNITITNSTTLTQTKQPLSATYNISARLCLPSFSLPSQANTVQFLVHGSTYDKTYWDFPITPFINSYVDYANELGYATFAIDRLGSGLSTHPANVNEVQGVTQIQIAHILIQKLRSGFYGKTFSKVVFIGHSYGSCLANGIAAAYPSDADAIVLTGYSHELYTPPYVFSDIGPANIVSPSRFGSLPDGYLTFNSSSARTSLFYHAPFFSTSVSNYDYQTEQTVVYPEFYDVLLPGPLVVTAPSFTGHVHYVNGDYDVITCGGPTFTQYSTPGNNVLSGELAYWPSADVTFTIIPFTGHCVNLHYTAPAAFADILAWNLLLGF